MVIFFRATRDVLALTKIIMILILVKKKMMMRNVYYVHSSMELCLVMELGRLLIVKNMLMIFIMVVRFRAV